MVERANQVTLASLDRMDSQEERESLEMLAHQDPQLLLTPKVP